MEITMSKTEEYEKPLIPEGFYDGILKDVKDISPAQFGDRVALIFEVQTEQGAVELAKVVYKKLTEKSAFTEILSVFGIEWEEGKKVETESLTGKKAKLVVENYEREGVKASTISKVKPLEETQDEKVSNN